MAQLCHATWPNYVTPRGALKDNSLLARILKVKYFARRGFLDADLGHNPSFAWRSIWSSQNLVKLGFRWKVGDGSQIRVWTDPWIRTLPSLKPSTPPPNNMEDLSVHDLMNNDMSSWNSDLIHTIFNFQDAMAILSTLFRDRNLVDSPVWKYSVDGSYTVKSAYSQCMSLAAEISPNLVGPYRNWSSLWKLPVPHKVCSFLWRVAHRCLPTRTCLIQKGVKCEETCVNCDALAETHIHIFFVCSTTIKCWELLQLDTIVQDLLLNTNDFTTLVFDFFDRLQLQQQLVAAMILWCIWKNAIQSYGRM